MSSLDLQKIKRTVDNLYTEKQKMEKEKNKKGKGKTKAKLRMEEDNVSPIIEFKSSLNIHHIQMHLRY